MSACECATFHSMIVCMFMSTFMFILDFTLHSESIMCMSVSTLNIMCKFMQWSCVCHVSMKVRAFPLRLSCVLERLSPLCAMPADKRVSKQSAGSNKKPAGVSRKTAAQLAAEGGWFRPAFKAGDIVMKAAFDCGVPFSYGLYTAVVTKSAKCKKTTHHVQFVKQLAVEYPVESEAHNQKQKPVLVHKRLHPNTKFEIAKDPAGLEAEYLGVSEAETECTSFRGRMVDSDVDRLDSQVSDSLSSNWEHLKLDSESSH